MADTRAVKQHVSIVRRALPLHRVERAGAERPLTQRRRNTKPKKRRREGWWEANPQMWAVVYQLSQKRVVANLEKYPSTFLEFGNAPQWLSYQISQVRSHLREQEVQKHPEQCAGIQRLVLT